MLMAQMPHFEHENFWFMRRVRLGSQLLGMEPSKARACGELELLESSVNTVLGDRVRAAQRSTMYCTWLQASYLELESLFQYDHT